MDKVIILPTAVICTLWRTKQGPEEPHLIKHVPKIILRAHPGGYSIAEENKVLKCDGSHVRGRPDQSPPSPQSPSCPTCTTPPGLTPIIMQMPRKAESFSSLSLMFLRDVHLQRRWVAGQGARICITWWGKGARGP